MEERFQMIIFEDRTDAGRKLACALQAYKGQETVVYALPRGGGVLGVEVAAALDAPLDLIIVRKIGHPSSPEYAIAAVAEDGDITMNRDEVMSVDRHSFNQILRQEQREAQRRRGVYMRGRTAIPAADKVAILVDDGLATGLTMFAAIREVQHFRPRKIVVAVPLAPRVTIARLKEVVDDVVVLHVPEDFGAIGSFYRRFDQVTDTEVIELMRPASTLQR